MTVGDAVVVGFEVGADGKVGVFRYDPRLAVVTRSPVPTWLSDVTFAASPAFSPEARYLAYLAALDDGTLRLVVRSWPGGVLRTQGPVVRYDSTARPRGAVFWRDHAQFGAGLPARQDSGTVWLTFGGRLDDPVVRVDTLRYFGP